MNTLNHLKNLRIKAGIQTVQEASEILKISESMIYQMERGERAPGKKLAIKMSKFYKCNLEEIILPIYDTFRAVLS